MTRAITLSLLVLGLVLLCVSDASAHCGKCKKKAAAACGPASGCGSAAKTAGCPITVALAKVKLTDAQKKKIATAKAACKASMAKAAGIGCSETAGKKKAAAGKKFKDAVWTALTPAQQKATKAAFGKNYTPPKKCCGGCGK